MGLLLTFFCVSIFFSFLCSILEAVLLSITPAYVGLQEQEKTPIANDLAYFKEDIDKPLAAILTLNTIAHTVGAIGVGSQATTIFGSTSLTVFGLELISWEALIAGVMTLAILILSEVIPKTIGANNWERLTPLTVQTLKIMLFLLAPFIWISQSITRNLKKEKNKPVLSRTDFSVMTDLGKETGALQENEQKIIQNLLRFSRVLVRDIMTPRIVVVAADESITVEKFHEEHEKLPFSRIPIYQKHPDQVTGYVLKNDIIMAQAQDRPQTRLSDFRRQVVVTRYNATIAEVFDLMISKREQLALVVDDDWGTMVGVVTMEDVVETLLGLEIVDEDDKNEDMQVLARRLWERRARAMGLQLDDQEDQPSRQEPQGAS